MNGNCECECPLNKDYCKGDEGFAWDGTNCSCKSTNPLEGQAVFDTGSITDSLGNVIVDSNNQSRTYDDFGNWCPAGAPRKESDCPPEKPAFDPATCTCYCKFDLSTPAHLRQAGTTSSAARWVPEPQANWADYFKADCCKYECTRTCSGSTPFLNKDTCSCECPVNDCVHGSDCPTVCSANAVWDDATCGCKLKLLVPGLSSGLSPEAKANHAENWHEKYTNTKLLPVSEQEVFYIEKT